jgi:hypothetical protein
MTQRQASIPTARPTQHGVARAEMVPAVIIQVERLRQ